MTSETLPLCSVCGSVRTDQPSGICRECQKKQDEQRIWADIVKDHFENSFVSDEELFHYCPLCQKTEICKEADCDFKSDEGYHSSCYAKTLKCQVCGITENIMWTVKNPDKTDVFCSVHWRENNV